MKPWTTEERLTKLEEYMFGEPDRHAPTGLLPRTARIEWKIDDLTIQGKEHGKILNQHTVMLEEHSDRLATLQSDVDGLRTDVDGLRTDVHGMRTDIVEMNVRLIKVETGIAEILRRLPEPAA
jgi:hypothetical protein